MAKRNVRIKAVRRDQVDVDKLVSGLMLLLEELAATGEPPSDENAPAPGEADR